LNLVKLKLPFLLSFVLRVAVAVLSFYEARKLSDDLFNGKHRAGLAGLNPVSGRVGGAKSARRVFSTAISCRIPGILATGNPAGWTTSKDNDLG